MQLIATKLNPQDCTREVTQLNLLCGTLYIRADGLLVIYMF